MWKVAIEATIDLRTLASQYMALLEDLEDNVAAGRLTIADVGKVRLVLGKLDDLVIDVLTTAVAERMDRERAM